MMKLKRNKYYPVDMRKKIIYNVPTDTKAAIEGRVKGTPLLFLAKRGSELVRKAFYEIDYTVESLENYAKARKCKAKRKKKHG